MHILIVDDNECAADFISLVLRREKHLVHTAYTGAEALHIAAQTPLDMVLLDISLPDCSGIQVAKTIRQTATNTPVIVAVSGHEQEQLQPDINSGLFDTMLCKPLSFKKLRTLLQHCAVAHPDAHC